MLLEKRRTNLRRICNNCAHAGKSFRLEKGGMTHMHCEHPKASTDPWDTLQEFWHSCQNHEIKDKKL